MQQENVAVEPAACQDMPTRLEANSNIAHLSAVMYTSNPLCQASASPASLRCVTPCRGFHLAFSLVQDGCRLTRTRASWLRALLLSLVGTSCFNSLHQGGDVLALWLIPHCRAWWSPSKILLSCSACSGAADPGPHQGHCCCNGPLMQDNDSQSCVSSLAADEHSVAQVAQVSECVLSPPMLPAGLLWLLQEGFCFGQQANRLPG